MSQTAVSGIWATNLMPASCDVGQTIKRLRQEVGTDLRDLQAEEQVRVFQQRRLFRRVQADAAG